MNNTRKKRYARRLDTDRVLKPQGIMMSKIASNIMPLDEFEAIRLVDYEGFSQTEAATEMQVSRATIQRLLTDARSKLVDTILYNKALEINNDIFNIKLKGENNINLEDKTNKIIAFPSSDKVTINAQCNFTEEFGIYTLKNTDVIDIKYIAPVKQDFYELPKYLKKNNVDIVITGCMDQEAILEYKKENIDVILGAYGRIDVNLNEYLGGFLTSKNLACDPNLTES